MKAIICWLVHGKREWWQWPHFRAWRCPKCGREGESDD